MRKLWALGNHLGGIIDIEQIAQTLRIRMEVMVCLSSAYKMVVGKLRSDVNIYVLHILSDVSLPQPCGVWCIQ